MERLRGFWNGAFRPLPVQRPRIPVWVAANWPNRNSVRRAARWDGLFPIDLPGPEQLTELAEAVRQQRAGSADPFDLIVEVPPGADVPAWEPAGATVPQSKRYRPNSPGVAIHTTTRPLVAGEVLRRDGIRVTSPARSIVDAAEAGTAPEQVVKAARESVERGLATTGQLRAATSGRGSRVEGLVQRALDEDPAS